MTFATTRPRPRILLIDDTPANLMLLGNALESEFDLQIATSGAMGLQLADEQAPDLILLDVMMPEMDGFETCRRMKAMPALAHIPVIFVTAANEINAESTGLALGAADYISKPINVEIARQRIRNLIEREGLRREVEAQRDLLETRVAERTAELEASEARFRSLIEQSVVGVFRFEGENIRYVNPGFARIHGFDSPEQILGHLKVQELVHPEYRDRMAALAEAASPGEPRTARFTGLRRDGSHVMLEAHFRLLSQGAHQEILGIVLDISEQQRAEVAQANALAAAENLATLKSNFVNNMSHELRTPLNGIIGLANMGRRSADLDKAHTTFGRITESSRHLLGLVETVLDFAAAESGELVPKVQPFDLNALLIEVASHWQLRAEAKHLAFSLEGLPKQSIGCLGDADRLRQVIDQLLENAIKFTAQGHVSLALELKQEAEQMRCRLIVSDSGIGMSPEQLNAAFSPFEQNESGLTRRFGGMGLGLALTKHLVHLMDGQISAESQIGHGTRFVIDLAFYRAMVGQVSMPSKPGYASSGRSYHVVLAIGSTVTRMLVEAYLSEIDARVEAFDKTDALFEKLKADAGEFDLLVTDLHFPDLSEDSFLQQVRSVAPHLPLIKLREDEGREMSVQLQPKPYERVRAGETEIDFSTNAFEHFLATVQELSGRLAES